MNNSILDPLYVFTTVPMDILSQIRLFMYHPNTEIKQIRKDIIIDNNIRLLEKIKKTYDDELHRYINIPKNAELSPDEEGFWKRYISEMISNKITYLKKNPNIEEIILYYKSYLNSMFINLHAINYQQSLYPFIKELTRIFIENNIIT